MLALANTAARHAVSATSQPPAWSTRLSGVQVGSMFNLMLDNRPAEVNGRLLPAPVIQYGSPKNYYAGTTGAWNMVDVRSLLLSYPHTLL